MRSKLNHRLFSYFKNLVKHLSFTLPLLFLFAVTAFGKGGIRGKISSAEGEILPYASIFVKQLGTGIVANENGFYEISLDPGRYELVFQFLSYESAVRIIDVTNDFVELNVTLKLQSVLLSEVVIGGNNEDPAYTIMRKAIAKSKYHTLQLDNYSARVYIKGAGKLKDYPWLAKRALQKEGVEKKQGVCIRVGKRN